ncbi:TonB-dependent receptor [Tenacibaculum mesophilum]|uniref:TonB-dependent receptor n=1 Tax=Tenacibaculum mesophilum TaxID=104268 RepID=UPI00374A3F4A
MVNKKTTFLFLFLFSFAIKAQDIITKNLLKDVLVEIEKKHQVTFTYSDKDLESVYIDKPDDSLSLSETINYLESVTIFNFKILDNRFITVSYLKKKIPICGTIVNSNTLEPLVLATILVNNTSNGTTSNTNGEFNINSVPAKANITISYIGYKPIILPAKDLFSQNLCKEIYLESLSEELSEVIIPNFLTTGLQKNIDGGTVLKTKNFGILPGLIEPDILKTIKVLPGVESVNESVSNINVRGGTNDQNLMLWDGIKMYHTSHFFGLISAYNPYLTEKATVTKNGTSTKFSDGVSSTVNMQTNNKITNTFSGGAGFNLLSADAFLQAPITKKLEIHASARRSYTDFFDTPTYDKYFNRSFQENSIASNKESEASTDFYFYDYSFKVLYDINKNHSLRANLISIKNNLEYTEEYTNNGSTVEENSNLKQENLGANISWNANWSPKFSTELSTFISDYTINSSDFNRETDQFQTQFNKVLESEIRLITNHHFSDVFQLTNGAVFNEIGVSNKTTVNAPTFSKSVKEVLLKSALFSEVVYRKNNTYARVGFRANYFHDFNKLIIEPRINLRQQLYNSLFLKLEGEFKNQTTAQKIDFQDNFLGIEKRRWILADNDKTPIIKSKQVSFGAEYSKNNLQIDLTGFYKFVDGITVANQGFYNNVQTLNSIGNYKVKGIEFLINKRTKKLSSWLSYSFTENNYTFETFTPDTFPSSLDIIHSFSSAINYNITNNFKLSLGAILRSGTPYTKPVKDNETIQDGNRVIVNYDTPNKERHSNFFRINASGSYNFNFTKNLKSTIRVGFTNISNRKNIINTYYIVDENNTDNVKEINTYSLPFIPNLSFRINF